MARCLNVSLIVFRMLSGMIYWIRRLLLYPSLITILIQPIFRQGKRRNIEGLYTDRNKDCPDTAGNNNGPDTTRNKDGIFTVRNKDGFDSSKKLYFSALYHYLNHHFSRH